MSVFEDEVNRLTNDVKYTAGRLRLATLRSEKLRLSTCRDYSTCELVHF